MPGDATRVMAALQARAAETSERDALGVTLVRSLKEALPKATWVGIYWLQGEELVLGPFVGPPTEHTRIPVGRGVCGTAVAQDRDQVVADVRTLDNYLACSVSTRSEIVVLLRSMGRVIGQIDLDSDQVGSFGEMEHALLRAAADSFVGLIH